MKKIITLLIFCFYSHSVSAEKYWQNLERLEYRGLTDAFPPYQTEEVYLEEQINDEILQWTRVINETVASIDPNFFKNNLDKKIHVTFFIDDRIKGKAFYMPENMINEYVTYEGIFINLFRDVLSIKSEVDWEIIDGDGYIDEAERASLFIHELGHYLNYNLPIIDTDWPKLTLEDSPTIGTGNYREDFADSFFLFAMWPDYLEVNYKERYDIIDNLVGDVFYINMEMPNSIRSMLCREYEGGKKVCGEGKVKSVLRTILFFLSVSLL